MAAQSSGQSREPSRTGGATRGLLAILMVAALAAGACGNNAPSPTPAPSASPTPGASATPSAAPTPSASPEAWADLQVAPFVEVASLEALKSGATGVAPDTRFRLTSRDGTPIAALAAGLRVSPAVQFATSPSGPNAVDVRPAKALTGGTVYRFAIDAPDGVLLASWAVNVATPPRVTGTLPGDATSRIPVNTGIEIIFDQAGIAADDMADHFRISPAVTGRFEVAGRTVAFVPNALTANTLYTVTVTRGLPLAGTGLTTIADTVFRFETGDPAAPIQPIVTFRRPQWDASTTEQAAIPIRVDRPGESVEPIEATVGITIHQLVSMDAAIAATRTLREAPDWTERTSTTPISTTGLTRVLAADAPLRPFTSNPDDEDQPSDYWIQVPQTLPAGWYLVTLTHRGVARQGVLQVADLSAFALLSVTRSVVWVNDVAAGVAVDGAAVTLDGTAIGATDAEGLLVATTPASAKTGATADRDLVIVVRDGTRQAFLVVTAPDTCEKCYLDVAQVRPDRWWTLAYSDRVRYRTTDTATLWGVVRERDTDTVPASVTVALYANEGDGVGDGALGALPIVTATATPDHAGAWLARLPFTDLPPGEYAVRISTGGAEVAGTWISVGAITKPAYRIDVTATPRALLPGEPVTVTARATFFEGTPVAGLRLRFGSSDPAVIATTGADGTATATYVPNAGESGDSEAQQDTLWVGVRPVEPEEADISGDAWVTVFASTALLGVDGTVSGTTVSVTGTVHDVDTSAYDGISSSEPWADVDAAGAPRAGASVSVSLVESWSTRVQTGTAYDFISKTVAPVYRWDYHERHLPPKTVTTGADGTYRASWTVTAGRSYEATATYRDEAGREIRDWASAYRAEQALRPDHPASLTEVTPLPDGNQHTYDVGETMRLQLLGGFAPRTDKDRYLFAVAQRGIRYATVGPGYRFSAPFTANSVPMIAITGVRFTGRGYEADVNGYYARFDTSTRAMTVSLTTDRAAYAPGDAVTVTVRTTDAAGAPTAASVFVKAVDEKLYAIGGAVDIAPLDDLYIGVASGVTGAAWSHANPQPWDDGGQGDTTGGGEREDFRDWLVAQFVRTDVTGTATLRFTLSDDLTSWRLSAAGVDAELRAGVASVQVPVSLPFFAEATVATEYLASDRPIIRVRAFGGGLSAGTPVTFTVASDSLGMGAVTVRGTAFEAAEVPLPALSAGTHRLRITAATGSGSTLRQDTLVRTIRVVDTRAVLRRTSAGPLVAGMTMGAANAVGATSILIADAGRGRVVPYLRSLTGNDLGRADRTLAAALAGRVLEDAFGIRPDWQPITAEDLARFQQTDEGVSILAYASGDLRLSVLAALTGDPGLNERQLHDAFAAVLDDDERSRTDRMLAIVGLVVMGDPRLGELREAAALPDLTAWERVALAAGAMAAGDETLARSLVRAELEAHGQRQGPWVRLAVDGTDDDAVLTSWLLMTAAWLGDPLALDMDAWLEANPPTTDLVDLERAIAARGWVARTPGAETVVAWTVDGVRREETIEAGGSLALSVTPAQRATLRLDPVSGSAVVAARWDAPAAATALDGTGITFTRRMQPSSTLASTDLAIVSLEVTLPATAVGGCWRVTDFAPSGLVPVVSESGWREEDESGAVPWTSPWREEDESGAVPWTSPWRVEGQRVDFCVSRNPNAPTTVLRYIARVVTPGTYSWEPAVLQSSIVPEQGAWTPPVTVTIRGLGG